MIVINKDGTVDPVHIGPIEVRIMQSVSLYNGAPQWIAVAFGGPDPFPLLRAHGPMPDDALNEVRANLPALRDALVLACMDVASLPGCGGVEMMGTEPEATPCDPC